MRFLPETQFSDPAYAADQVTPEVHVLTVNNLRKLRGLPLVETVHAGEYFDGMAKRMGATVNDDSFVLHTPAGPVTVRS